MKQDESMFDSWSIQHFTSGAVIAGFGVINIWQFFLLHSIFEVWENTIGIAEWKEWGWKKYQGDSILNIIGDTLSGLLGFYLVSKLTKGKMAPLEYLVPLIGIGAFITYNHPPPPDKIHKGVVSIGTLTGLGLGLYLLRRVI